MSLIAIACTIAIHSASVPCWNPEPVAHLFCTGWWDGSVGSVLCIKPDALIGSLRSIWCKERADSCTLLSHPSAPHTHTDMCSHIHTDILKQVSIWSQPDPHSSKFQASRNYIMKLFLKTKLNWKISVRKCFQASYLFWTGPTFQALSGRRKLA